ncbi:MAG: dTDP-4-dehydrorhamnose 3,5-epimerase family protein [Ignavibacteriales bacterium]|nr:dTDP-4-dehydrorhamnose 3,5-epimerase family protein [Ignavibacteriales bacterium]
MTFTNGPIDGLVVRELVAHADPRGWLTELFRSDEVKEEFMPVMAYVSATLPGVARGPHEHVHQADFFCFVGPSVFKIVCWDNRRRSRTYGNTVTLEAGAGKPMSVLVPPGVVHGYKNIGDAEGWVLNFPNRLYAGKGKKEKVDEIRHELDPSSIFIID